MAYLPQFGVRAGIAALIWLSSIFAATAQQAGEVPRADRVSPAVTRYSRVTPQIAAAGLLREAALAELKSLGFVMVIDLRGPEEGTEHERRTAAMVAMRYENIPVTADIPADVQIVAFASLVEDAGNHPLLVHCASASRVGAMWALYRAARGVPFEAALAEAHAIGLQGAREQAVRARLAKPPFTQ